MNLFLKLIKNIFACLIGSILFADSPQQWAFINTNFYKTPTREFLVTTHARMLEGDTLSLYQIQPKYAFKLSDWFWGSTNYSFFGVRQLRGNEDEAEIANQHRFEIEVQPRIQLSDNWRLSGRDRIEYLLNESFEHENHRFRHRTAFQYDGFKDTFASLITQCEVFFDFGQSRWNQFRTVPIGVKFNAFDTGISLLPTMLSNYRDDDWRHTFVAVLELNFDFTD